MEFPKGGLIGRTVHSLKAVAALRIPVYAAHVSYFIMLALLPCLTLLAQLLSFTSLDVHQLVQLLSGILPAAFSEGAEALILTAADTPPPALLGLSALTLLWAAGRGIYGVRTGLNAVYGITEIPGYLHGRFSSILYTLGFLAVLLLTLLLQVFAAELLQLLQRCSHPFVGFALSLIDLRFFLLLFLQTLVFTLMFMVLPHRRNRFPESLPGALLASCGWLIFSDLFSLYMKYSFRYGALYGPVSALIPGMLWLYCCMSIVLYGGALNAMLKKWK